MKKFEIKDGVLVKFNNVDNETEITIPNGVTSIGRGAFPENCKIIKRGNDF